MMMVAIFYFWRATSIGFGQFSSTGLGHHSRTRHKLSGENWSNRFCFVSVENIYTCLKIELIVISIVKMMIAIYFWKIVF